MSDLLTALVDAQLEGESRKLLEDHLAGCPRCRRDLESQRDMKSLLRRTLRVRETPPAVRARLLQRLSRETAITDTAITTTRATTPASAAETSWRQGLATFWGSSASRLAFAATAAALLIAALLPALQPVKPLSLEEVAAHFREISSGELQLAAHTSDLATLRAFFARSGYFDFDHTVVDLSALGFRPLGGSIGNLDGRAATVTVYEGPGGRILCHRLRLTKDTRLPDGGEVVGKDRFYTIDGITIRVHEDRGVLCFLATRMPREEFMRLLRT